MKAVVQRVRRGVVLVEDKVLAEIEQGLVVLLGVATDDTSVDVNYMVDKIANLRIFDDEKGKLNLSVGEAGGKVLIISNFTLYGDCRKGRRPSFTGAATPTKARDLYNMVLTGLRRKGLNVYEGKFQEKMVVEITNDGPVTLLLDSKKAF
ncbi:MAG TPA: D-tyrosyl-tRNA(Tyr) deacylase [Actinobacteria bacterium]|nr:D-tyrosyl-tRNA(Tyr) deacylase [Actinomycetota bacterium]